MRTPLLAAHAGPYPCHTCGVTVRTVRTTQGHLVTITNAPHPDGNIIPWPSAAPNGLAEARIYDQPIRTEPAWIKHACGYH